MSEIIIGDMPKPSLLMVMWETIIGINDIFETVIVESNIFSQNNIVIKKITMSMPAIIPVKLCPSFYIPATIPA